MCGVYGLNSRSLEDYRSAWNLAKYLDLNWQDRYNIRPTQSAPVIYQDAEGNKIDLMKFGLIPSWSKFEKLEFNTINARSEDIEKKPTYREPFKSKRCLIPANFFFEFAKTKQGSVGHLYKLKNDQPMLFAGVFDINGQATDKPILSFAIITSEANDLVEKIHPRMPVILDQDDAKEWLNPDNNGETEKLKKLLHPYPDIKMESWTVSKLVNNFRNEGPEVIKPIK